MRLCTQYKEDYWMPREDFRKRDNLRLLKKGAKICRKCPSKKECYEKGKEIRYGVWGGKIYFP